MLISLVGPSIFANFKPKVNHITLVQAVPKDIRLVVIDSPTV